MTIVPSWLALDMSLASNLPEDVFIIRKKMKERDVRIKPLAQFKGKVHRLGSYYSSHRYSQTGDRMVMPLAGYLLIPFSEPIGGKTCWNRKGEIGPFNL